MIDQNTHKIKAMYDNLLGLMEKLIFVLSTDYNSDKSNDKVVQKYILGENGWSIGDIKVNERLYSHSNIIHYMDSICDMKKSKNLFKVLLGNKFIKNPSFVDSNNNTVESPDEKSVLWSGLLHGNIFYFISRYLDQIDTLNFDKNIFDKLYCDFESYTINEKAKFVGYIPLLNFSSDMKNTKFDNGVEIIYLEPNKREYFANSLFYREPNTGDLCDVDGIFKSGFAFKFIFEDNKRSSLSGESINCIVKKSEKIITALRLLKSGDLYLSNFIFSESINNFNPPLVEPLRNSIHSNFASDKYSGEIFNFNNNSDFKICNDIFKVLIEDNLDVIEIALRRFSDIYRRELSEDKIIDMAILLESILLYGISNELSYRFCLRGAYLLENKREKDKTFKTLGEFYRIRSNIVHGNDKKNYSCEVVEVENICREIIKLIIEELHNKNSLENIIKNIDKSILYKNNV
ncbi:MAG: hypothetical protein AABY84_05770 [Candidatus Firestonebacteria bacterium]